MAILERRVILNQIVKKQKPEYFLKYDSWRYLAYHILGRFISTL
jgi:hypothetical protein